METEELGSSTDKVFWRDHVLKAKEFSGAAVEYCRQNGLKASTFYSYKRRLGFASKASSRKKFVKVVSEAGELKRPVRALPDPKWLAEFVLSVLRGR